MEVMVWRQGFIFRGTWEELKSWLATFPREWNLAELVRSHFE